MNLKNCRNRSRYLKDLLTDEVKRFAVIRKELLEIKEKFGDARKTEITYLDDEVRIKDLIKEEDVVITISHSGYIKRTSATEYRQQRRGGRGLSGGKTREEDYIEHLFVASSHHTLLVFYRKRKMLLAERIPDTGGRPGGQGQGDPESDPDSAG